MTDVLSMLEFADADRTLRGKPGPGSIMIQCPIHAGGMEKTPSCSVSTEQPVWFCHGCKESGHLSKLLRHMGVPTDLAKRMVDQGSFASTQQGFIRRNGLYRRYEGPNPYRGQFILDEEFMDEYRLAPSELLNQGFLLETLKHFEVGFDYQHMRITYPIRNLYGELVGISGRTVVGDIPRYKLYRSELVELGVAPENYKLEKDGVMWHAHMLYRVLYKVPEPIIIVEGFKAAMWVWQAGIHNVTALIGSYLTDLHANLLSVLRVPVFLFLDNNEAGIVGTEKAIKKLKANELYIARYPDLREQPDDLTPEEVLKALRQSHSYSEWMREDHEFHEATEYPSKQRRFRPKS